jgi:hypothetical protein
LPEVRESVTELIPVSHEDCLLKVHPKHDHLDLRALPQMAAGEIKEGADNVFVYNHHVAQHLLYAKININVKLSAKNSSVNNTVSKHFT